MDISRNLRTSILVEGLPEDFVTRLKTEAPLKRLSEPEEVAGVISFVLSGEAAYLPGPTVVAIGSRFLQP